MIFEQNKLLLIAGPCSLENEKVTFSAAEKLAEIGAKFPEIKVVFKGSFDKANRTSIYSKRGVGLESGLDLFREVKKRYDLPVTTDIHLPEQAAKVADVVDLLQIPAFLCRQTDMLIAAAKTGCAVSVKKGQFLSPNEMKHVVGKLVEAGASEILQIERGSTFGYNNLVVDMRGLVDMRSYGYPVVFDATHSVQKPSINGTTTGGDRRYVPYLMNAALSIGVDAIFAEVHPCPEKAWSDAANQLKLSDVRPIITHAIAVDSLTKNL
ncbi:MAG: 3-deoxy-8-phosphooctulonate synthase [Sphingobacteriia bacterium]|nr:3-deoxy-8-phosphooctulonate synthase [Sphingobacteriia bacterium]